MNKKHQKQTCGCLLVSLLAIGMVICAATRVVQEIKKRIPNEPSKVAVETHSIQAPRITPSQCR